jgi:hypothetical protein
VKRIGILALIAVTALSLGCGDPAVGKLQTITLTAASTTTTGGFYNLYGEGGTLQLVATGNYSSTATKPLTNLVTYTVTSTGTDLNGAALASPPQTLTISTTGLVTAVTPFICTWEDVTPSSTTPSWFLTGSYKITATYNGVTSQPVYLGVASAAGNGPGDACGPTPSS